MAKERKIVWSLSATNRLIDLLSWIKDRSIQGSEIVEEGIYSKLEQVRKYPFRFPPDKYRLGNNGNFRNFISHSYSVTYEVTEQEIRVVRIIHVKQKPKNY